jgi:hypothetical protein
MVSLSWDLDLSQIDGTSHNTFYQMIQSQIALQSCLLYFQMRFRDYCRNTYFLCVEQQSRKHYSLSLEYIRSLEDKQKTQCDYAGWIIIQKKNIFDKYLVTNIIPHIFIIHSNDNKG